MNLNNYLNSFTTDEIIKQELINYLALNNWFNYELKLNDGQIEIDDNFAHTGKQLTEFIYNLKSSDKEKLDYSFKLFKEKYPETSRIIIKFFNISNNISDENKNYVIRFLLNNLVDEITRLSDKEVKSIIENAMECLNYNNCQILSLLFAYTKQHYRTFYVSDFFLEKEEMPNNDAYEVDEYCRILYHMFNEDYIKENDMYYKATLSKSYIDT